MLFLSRGGQCKRPGKSRSFTSFRMTVWGRGTRATHNTRRPHPSTQPPPPLREGRATIKAHSAPRHLTSSLRRYGVIVIDSVAAIDVKDIGRKWGISHAHLEVYALHSESETRRRIC